MHSKFDEAMKCANIHMNPTTNLCISVVIFNKHRRLGIWSNIRPCKLATQHRVNRMQVHLLVFKPHLISWANRTPENLSSKLLRYAASAHSFWSGDNTGWFL